MNILLIETLLDAARFVVLVTSVVITTVYEKLSATATTIPTTPTTTITTITDIDVYFWFV